jgi:hypothetical protein
MHYGYVGLQEKNGYSFKKHWKKYVFFTTLYTVVVGVLVGYGVLPSAQDIIAIFR